MPSHSIHELLDALLLGKKKAREMRAIHDAIDAPVKILGPRHRSMFHDPQTAIALGVLTRDEKVMVSALGHQFLDRGMTSVAGKVMRFLKSLARD